MTAQAWTCPACGRQFANANQWHSCGRYTVDDHLDGAADELRLIYERLVAAARQCGDIRIDPVKTAIELRTHSAFAAVKIRKRWVDLALMMPRPLDSPRVMKAMQYGPTGHEVTVRLTAGDDVDGDIEAWLCEACDATELRRPGR